MEEDRKLVEQRLDYYEESPEGCNWRVSFEGNEITQLRNLLTRYKQLEEYYKEQNEVNAKFIPKSKVKEKIEELETKKKEYGFGSIESMLFLNKIQVLQELLGEE